MLLDDCKRSLHSVCGPHLRPRRRGERQVPQRCARGARRDRSVAVGRERFQQQRNSPGGDRPLLPLLAAGARDVAESAAARSDGRGIAGVRLECPAERGGGLGEREPSCGRSVWRRQQDR